MSIQLRARHRSFIAFVLLLGSSGCEDFGCPGESCSSSSGSSGPVKTLSYSESQMQEWRTIAVTPNVLSYTNFAPTTFSITPALPAGLDFDQNTGRITGTPQEVLASTVFEVAAFDGNTFQVSTHVPIVVFDDVAPSGLSYQPSAVSVLQGDALPSLVASFTGAPESFSVSPPLPAGVAIDPQIGTIAGICSGQAAITQHTVTVSNPFGSAQADVEITVLEAPSFEGLLVASQGDLTLDVFGHRNVAFAPIDAEYCFGAVPRDVAATYDGKFVYTACSNGHVYVSAHDRVSGRTGELTDLGQLGMWRKMAISFDSRYLIAARDLAIERYEIQPDGSLCCVSQVAGPFAPTALVFATNDVLVVASIGAILVYDVAPTLQVRGPQLDLGPGVFVSDLELRVPGQVVYAATSVYDINTSTLTGTLRNLKLSTPAEIAAGAAVAVQTQSVVHGGDLTALVYVPDSVGQTGHLVVADGSMGRLSRFISGANATISNASPGILVVGGRPSKIVARPVAKLLVLDETNEEIVTCSDTFPTMTVDNRVRTRRQPCTLVPLFGQASTLTSRVAFVTSATDSTLLAVRSDATTSGELVVSTQGPVASGATPLDVIASDEGPFVYTANRDGSSISAFRFDESGSMQLTAIETEALLPGDQPCALAITPSGRHLFALDQTGLARPFEIDPSDGSLTIGPSLAISGSTANALIRADVLGRYLFVVQPAAGRVDTLSINLPSGFLLPSSSLTSIAQPADLWLSIDGRFAYVLDQLTARVVAFRIDTVSGNLVALGSSTNLVGSPTRLVSAQPFDLLHTFPSLTLLALDPLTRQALPIDVDPKTGVFSATLNYAADLPLGAQSIGVVEGVGFNDVLLSASDDGASGQLASFKRNDTAQAWVPVDTVALGRGPLAIAKRPRLVAP